MRFVKGTFLPIQVKKLNKNSLFKIRNTVDSQLVHISVVSL